jgi:type IV secretory pathway protease TraF
MRLRLLHHATVLLVVSTLYAATAAGASALARHLIWNRTDSLPHGLYWVTAGLQSPLRPGDLVAFPLPPAVQRLVYARRYLRPGDWLLKPVVALSGDDVCTDGGLLSIRGTVVGPMLERDSAGRPLPRFPMCGPVPAGHVFTASPTLTASILAPLARFSSAMCAARYMPYGPTKCDSRLQLAHRR